MPATLEATRLWMLALCLASIPLTVASVMVWEMVRPRSLSWHRHRTAAGIRPPIHLSAPRIPLSRTLLIHVPFVLAVTILTAYLVFVLVSNTL